MHAPHLPAGAGLSPLPSPLLPPPSAKAGNPLLPALPFRAAMALGPVSNCTDQILLLEIKSGGGRGGKKPYFCKHGCHVHDSRSHGAPACSSWGAGPPSQPLLPPVLCTNTPTPSSPQVLACDDKSMFAVDLKKIEFLQLGAIPPCWYLQAGCCALDSFPPPLAKKQGCVFAEPLFGIPVAGGEGLAIPGQERSTSLRWDHGQLECTEELFRAHQDQAKPAPRQGLSG